MLSEGSFHTVAQYGGLHTLALYSFMQLFNMIHTRGSISLNTQFLNPYSTLTQLSTLTGITTTHAAFLHAPQGLSCHKHPPLFKQQLGAIKQDNQLGFLPVFSFDGKIHPQTCLG